MDGEIGGVQETGGEQQGAQGDEAAGVEQPGQEAQRVYSGEG